MSFYVAGGTLRHNSPSYVQRKADQHLFAGLRDGQFCYVLTSRQMGKSSLMVRTAGLLKDAGGTVAQLDLTQLGRNVTEEQWYDGLLSAAAEQLGLEAEIEEYWLAHHRLSPFQRWAGALREIVLERSRGAVVIFVDEIDTVRALPFSADEFFAGIRECYNRRSRDPEFERLTFCLLGVATPSDLIRDTRTTPFNIGLRIQLTDFTPHEAAPLAAGLHMGGGEARVLLERVLYWTGGHPYLTQRLCRALAEATAASSAADVDLLCADLFFHKRAREQDSNLLFVRERLIRSEAEQAGLLCAYEEVWRGQRVTDDETNPLVNVLLLSGIVRAAGGRLAVRNRIYERVFDRPWIRAHMPDAELRRLRAAYLRGWLRAGAVFTVFLLVVLLAVGLSVRDEWESRLLSDGQQGAVRRAIFSPDGRLVVSVGEDAKVIVWDFERRQKLATFTDHTGWVTSVAFSPDGRWFATGGRDHTVIVWDAARLVKVKVLRGHQGSVNAIAFSPDGKALASSDLDRTILWETRRWEKLRELVESSSSYGSLSFSPDGRWLIYRGNPALDLAAGRGVPTPDESFNWAALSRDGTHMAGVNPAGEVSFFGSVHFGDRPGRKLQGGGPAHQDHGRSMAFSPDGRLVASAAEDIALWDAVKHTVITRFEHSAIVWSVDFSPDGRWLISGHGDGSILLWELDSRTRAASFGEHSAPVRSVAFAPDGKRIASASEDYSVIVWDAWSGRKEAVFTGHTTRVTGVALAPDGSWAASCDFQGKVICWDVASGHRRWEVDYGKGKPLYCVAVSPDERWVATGRGVYRSADGQQVSDFSDGPVRLQGAVYGLAFSADGRRLALATEHGHVAIVDTDDWRILYQQVMTGAQLISVSFSPDGQFLATGEDEGPVRLWSVAPLRAVAVLGQHTSRVKAVAFSPDGRQVASAGDDRTISLWDVGRRELIQHVGAHAAPVLSLAFSPDGRLVSGEHDKTVKLHTRHHTLWGYRWN